jgi:peptidoglycan hydrolase CwlO-like protein
MIGIPGGPPPAPVATQTQIAHLSQQVDMLGDKITNLEKELKTLEERTRSKPVQAKKIAGQLRAPGPKKIH